MTRRVLVVGDSMLDRYWDGRVERISPEAPVPVLRMVSQSDRPGGAANVAVNVAALRGLPTLATLLGDDEAGDCLARLVQQQGVRLEAVRSTEWVTTLKIRAVCRRHQLLRVDVERDSSASHGPATLHERVAALLPGHRWVLLSDYAKGALRNCASLIARVAAQGAHAIVDPKGHDFERYRGAWLLKPNEDESRAVAGDWHDEADFLRRMAGLREHLALPQLLVTRGELGMTLFAAGRAPRTLAATAREVFDLSGAGDTVLAALAVALAEGQPLDDAVAFANAAAGVVVGKFGTAHADRDEVERGLRRSAAEELQHQDAGLIVDEPAEPPRPPLRRRVERPGRMPDRPWTPTRSST